MRGQIILKKDIARGVKLLKDGSYHYNTGSTSSSLEFFKHVSKYMSQAKKAVLKYSHKHGYNLSVFTMTGQQVVFQGCSFGYAGQGSRASVEILKALGFNERQVSKVMKNRDVKNNDKMTLQKTYKITLEKQ